MITTFDSPNNIKGMAYGVKPRTDANQGYRVRRGVPLYRAGKPVVATPGFRALSVFTPTAQTAEYPPVTTTPNRNAYPIKVK